MGEAGRQLSSCVWLKQSRVRDCHLKAVHKRKSACGTVPVTSGTPFFNGMRCDTVCRTVCTRALQRRQEVTRHSAVHAVERRALCVVASSGSLLTRSESLVPSGQRVQYSPSTNAPGDVVTQAHGRREWQICRPGPTPARAVGRVPREPFWLRTSTAPVDILHLSAAPAICTHGPDASSLSTPLPADWSTATGLPSRPCSRCVGENETFSAFRGIVHMLHYTRGEFQR